MGEREHCQPSTVALFTLFLSRYLLLLSDELLSMNCVDLLLPFLLNLPSTYLEPDVIFACVTGCDLTEDLQLIEAHLAHEGTLQPQRHT